MAVRGERGGEGWRRGHSGDGGLVHDSRQTDRTLEAVVEKRKDGSMAFSLQWCLYRVEPLEQQHLRETTPTLSRGVSKGEERTVRIPLCPYSSLRSCAMQLESPPNPFVQSDNK